MGIKETASNAISDFKSFQEDNLAKAKEQGATGWADYHSGRSINPETGNLEYGLNQPDGAEYGPPAAGLVSALSLIHI